MLKRHFVSDTYQLTIELPQTVKDLLPDAGQEAKRLIAMKLYQNGGVSVAWAAEVAGMDRYSFADLLTDNNITIRQQTLEQVMADAASLKQLRGK
jgi:predicted HTH domain antitoxin